MDLWLHVLRFKYGYKDILVIDLNFFNAEWETFSPWPRHLSDTAGQKIRHVTYHHNTTHTHSILCLISPYLTGCPLNVRGFVHIVLGQTTSCCFSFFFLFYLFLSFLLE